jgi:galactose mutarotase-like enzyme
MYWKLMRQRFTEWRIQVWEAIVVRSGIVTMALLAFLLVGVALAWREHKEGYFAQLKAGLRRPVPTRVPPAPQPGGQDAIVLERSAIEGGRVPEFLSATLLPGRGLNVLQIKAFVPGKGEVSLLTAPALDEANSRMTGKGDDADGAASLAMGGAIEAPWAGKIFGTSSDDAVSLLWNGQRRIDLPAARYNGAVVARGGLLLRRSATTVKTNVMPDGGEAEATYDAGNFDERWPSGMQLNTAVQLSSRSLEMKVVARNMGQEPQPVGIGWQPRFAVSGNRGSLMLRLPSVTRIETRDRRTGLPSGRLLSTAGTPYDFSGRTGVALGELSLDDTFVHLRQAPLDNGPVAELLDPTNNYGLRITMLSSTIKAVHVEAPTGEGFVTIDPRFNYEDPFGREWPKDEDTGMVVLKPGQSAHWRVRLEIFALTVDKGVRL